jgi:hypothetical protein
MGGMSTASSALVSVAVVAAGIALYHVTLAPRPAPPSSAETGGSVDETIASLRRDVDALKRRSGDSGSAAPAPSDRLDALASRIQSLEERLIPGSAQAGANQGRLPPGVGDRTFTEEQIESLRSMMDEVEARRNTDRETASYRDLVRRVAPTISGADEATAVSLVTGFMRKLRALFVDGSAGNTEEERAATAQKAAAEREKLLADLGTVLPKDVVERLAQHIPDFNAQPGHTPPNREAPK